MKQFYTFPTDNVLVMAVFIFSMEREDWILTNKNSSRFTTRPQEGFFTFSQLFRQQYAGYGLDKNHCLIPTTARTVNFKNLINVLKSKDEKLFEQNQWIFDGEFRFLDSERLGFNKIAFNTFPRSGNSFLRRLLEQATGVATGATIHLQTATNLQTQGLKGE